MATLVPAYPLRKNWRISKCRAGLGARLESTWCRQGALGGRGRRHAGAERGAAAA